MAFGFGVSIFPAFWRTTSIIDLVPIEWVKWVFLGTVLGAVVFLSLILYPVFSKAGFHAPDDYPGSRLLQRPSDRFSSLE